jgi:cytochrome c553
VKGQVKGRVKGRAALQALILVLGGLTAGAAVAQDHAARYARTCAPCHGASGQSELAMTPSLGGQPSFYAITQLFLYKNERRAHPAMVALAQGMDDRDLRGFSDVIALLPPPPAPASPPDPERLARGRASAERHRCLACHGSDGAGGKQVARIAHQREDYLQRSLQAFKAGTRIGYTQAMNEAVAPLKAEEIDDLAHFLAHLP